MEDKPWSHIETNPKKVIKTLTAHGPRTSRELCRYTGLARLPCRYAIHNLTQEGLIELKGSLYQLTASKYAPYMIARVWNKAVFEGTTL